MKAFLIFFVLAAWCLGDSAEAAQAKIIGHRTLSCGWWMPNRRDRSARVSEQWILGFLSGVAYVGGDAKLNPSNGVDAYGVWAWSDNYCLAHPIDQIEKAAVAFVDAHPR
jgi:hypothetical protein